MDEKIFTVDEPLLSRKEEKELSILIHKGGKKGSEARERFIKANLRLVIKIAGDYRGCGMDIGDMVNEGNIGLMTAVTKFDPTQGTKFSTYGSYWIKQKITRALSEKGKLIRLPVYLDQKQHSIFKYVGLYRDRRNEEPSVAHLCSRFKVTEAQLKKIYAAKRTIVNLDQKFDDSEDSRSFGDIIEDKLTPCPSATALKGSDFNTLMKYVDSLKKRERFIIVRRFGLGGHDKQTLEQIGDKLSITRERVRQIENIIFRKLKRLISKEHAIKL
jgi:RNA polymerase primary sigma factor